MNNLSKSLAIVSFLLLSQFASAKGGSLGSFDSITDGSAGATLGTNLYNTFNRKHPLPVHGGNDDVVKQTLSNMGAGQGVKDAWKNAAQAAAGDNNTSPSHGSQRKP